MITHNYLDNIPLHCINEAAIEYKVPAKLIISVLNVERGRIGQAVRNKNGSYDLGPMQINTSWWPRLYQYDITPREILYNPCKNVKVGTWILAKSIADGHNLLNGIGNYNSHEVMHNRLYIQQVKINYKKVISALST